MNEKRLKTVYLDFKDCRAQEVGVAVRMQDQAKSTAMQ